MRDNSDHDFGTVSHTDLAACDEARLDALPFGVIGFGPDTEVEIYNATESRLAGLSRERVVGRQYFSVVAPCMNNFLVAQRFEDEDELDAVIDYVLTLRMRPTKVRLRMLKRAGESMRYILIQR
jgi:photoactive yellow protein